MTRESLIALIDRLDVISIAIHRSDVAHISLIGYPKDVLELEGYFSKRAEKRKPPVQLSLDLEPYLPLR